MNPAQSGGLLLMVALVALFFSMLGLVLCLSIKRSQKIDQQILKETKQMQRLLQGQLVVMGQRILALEQALRDNSKTLFEAQPASPQSKHRAFSNNADASLRRSTGGKNLQKNDNEINANFDFAEATAVAETSLSDSELVESGDDDLTALARRLLAAGESPDVVAERCNLSQSEMDLLQAMYQPSAS